MSNHTFDFLKDIFPELMELGRSIEDVFYHDPQTVLIKGRIFSEKLSKRIAVEQDLHELNYLKQVERIQRLEKEDILPREIAGSFDTVRYLGNKAAHEHMEGDLENAFKVHKHLFQIAVWFMEVYGSYEFVAQKYRHPRPKTNMDAFMQLEEKLNSSLEEKLKVILEHTRTNLKAADEGEASKGEEQEKEDNQAEKDENAESMDSTDKKEQSEERFILKEGESYLLAELSKLKESSQEAIENSNQFSSFKEYLHVKRTIQDDLMSALNNAAETSEAQLIFLCGSVGDGKSHLLAYMNNKYSQLMESFSIHNDATESFDPQKSSLDTLAEVLKPFRDDEIETSGHKLILAINLGVLHNFIESDYAKKHYQTLTEFIRESKIFEASVLAGNQMDDYFHLISFSDYQPFELTEDGPKSAYFSTILDRLVVKSEENPFYRAYQQDKERGISGFFMTNYELIQMGEIREGIVSLLVAAIVKHKTIISTRALLNFIHDILVPAHGNGDFLTAGMIEKTEALLPNLLFAGQDRSHLLAIVGKMDPIHLRSNIIDQILIELNNSLNIRDTFERHLDLQCLEGWIKGLEELGPFFELSGASRQLFNKTLIRMALFLSKTMEETFLDSNYQQYMQYLYAFNAGNRSGLKSMYDLTKKSIFLWNGSPKDEYVYMDKSNRGIQVAQSLIIKPSFAHLSTSEDRVLNRFKLNLLIAFGGKDKTNTVFLEVDYPLYEMMVKLSKGYRPNKKDKEDCIQFVEFIDRVMKMGNKEEELLFVRMDGNAIFRLTYDEDYEEFTFRRE
ncbi:DNA phosphorothioation-dependent restriction protein DptF [Priestia abyssalis]|uniref:DNA phosphorothioation-dependent restriction protein DptF n=1 Tax=Priestia abyssalis TaxID=1221450 RepID=UPI0011172980|nr:DNA phosphorothioation-dependent restriction protein DptF [Priestia abyssalis]